jgi:glutamine synthetase
VTDKAMELFERYKVLTKRELMAREEVLLETYSTRVTIEARTLLQMLSTQVLPAALRYQEELAGVVTASNSVSVDCRRTSGRLTDVGKFSEDLQKTIESLSTSLELSHENSLTHAQSIRDSLLPEMANARLIADTLETLIPDDIWPLPSYTEMLFIR